VDHKRIGISTSSTLWRFLVTADSKPSSFAFQLMYPHNDFVSPQVFNRMFTMHGTTMIFFVAVPVLFGFANYLSR
jgi:cytochrome c oxidase subunit 1